MRSNEKALAARPLLVDYQALEDRQVRSGGSDMELSWKLGLPQGGLGLPACQSLFPMSSCGL